MRWHQTAGEHAPLFGPDLLLACHAVRIIVGNFERVSRGRRPRDPAADVERVAQEIEDEPNRRAYRVRPHGDIARRALTLHNVEG